MGKPLNYRPSFAGQNLVGAGLLGRATIRGGPPCVSCGSEDHIHRGPTIIVQVQTERTCTFCKQPVRGGYCACV